MPSQDELRFQIENAGAVDLPVQEIDQQHLTAWKEVVAGHPFVRRFVHTKGYRLELLLSNEWMLKTGEGEGSPRQIAAQSRSLPTVSETRRVERACCEGEARRLSRLGVLG